MKLHDLSSENLLKVIHEASKILSGRTIKESYEEYGLLSLSVDDEVVASGSFADLMDEAKNFSNYEWYIYSETSGEIIADNEGFLKPDTMGYNKGELRKKEKAEKEAKKKALYAKYTPQQLKQLIVDRVKASPRMSNVDDVNEAYEIIYDIIEKLGLDDLCRDHSISIYDIIDAVGIKEKSYFEKYPNMLKKAVQLLADDIGSSWPDKDPADSVMDVLRRFKRNASVGSSEWDIMASELHKAFENEHNASIYDYFDQLSDDIWRDRGNSYRPPMLGNKHFPEKFKKMILQALTKFGVIDFNMRIGGNNELILTRFKPELNHEILAAFPRAIQLFFEKDGYGIKDCEWQWQNNVEQLVVYFK